MQDAKIFNLVFSSSATVYGNPINIPIDENYETNLMNIQKI